MTAVFAVDKILCLQEVVRESAVILQNNYSGGMYANIDYWAGKPSRLSAFCWQAQRLHIKFRKKIFRWKVALTTTLSKIFILFSGRWKVLIPETVLTFNHICKNNKRNWYFVDNMSYLLDTNICIYFFWMVSLNWIEKSEMSALKIIYFWIQFLELYYGIANSASEKKEPESTTFTTIWINYSKTVFVVFVQHLSFSEQKVRLRKNGYSY